MFAVDMYETIIGMAKDGKKRRIKATHSIPVLFGVEAHEKHHITRSFTTCNYTKRFYLIFDAHESLKSHFYSMDSQKPFTQFFLLKKKKKTHIQTQILPFYTLHILCMVCLARMSDMVLLFRAVGIADNNNCTMKIL